jgi:hypothetical protein
LTGRSFRAGTIRSRHRQLFENGKRLIAKQSWDELNQVIARLWDLVPADERGTDEEARMFTGIV